MPDLRGFGWIGRAAAGPIDPDVFARDLIALLDALGLEQVDLAGHDWGGFTSLLLSARHPERVRTVVAHLDPAPVGEGDAADRARDVARVVRGAVRGRADGAQRRARRAGSSAARACPRRTSTSPRLRDPARASATTRLYRAYLRTLARHGERRRGGAALDRPEVLLLIGEKRPGGHAEARRGLERGGDDTRSEVVPRRRALHVRHARAPRRRARAVASASERERLQRLHRVRLTPKLSACDIVSSWGPCSRCWPCRRRGMLKTGGAPTGGAGYGAAAPAPRRDRASRSRRAR